MQSEGSCRATESSALPLDCSLSGGASAVGRVECRGFELLRPHAAPPAAAPATAPAAGCCRCSACVANPTDAHLPRVEFTGFIEGRGRRDSNNQPSGAHVWAVAGSEGGHGREAGGFACLCVGAMSPEGFERPVFRIGG